MRSRQGEIFSQYMDEETSRLDVHRSIDAVDAQIDGIQSIGTSTCHVVP
jgi:hypothetical protein